MNLRRVEYGSSAYRDCLRLRRRILREPLGLDWSEADLAGEEDQQHFGLYDGELLVACVVARPLGMGRVQLRQMAVDLDRQGKGVGRNLLSGVLDLLRNDGVREVELHAREEAVGFYQRAGFVRQGERFREIGIPHWKMHRKIER